MKFLIAIIMLINASALVAQEVDQTNPYKMLRTVAENTFS
jgi:phospholipid transport system substrate-binding protein